MVGDVTGDDELGLLGAEVVGGQVIGVLQAKFGTEEDGRADPVPVAEEVLGVLGGVAGTLSLDVVYKFVAYREVVVGLELRLRA